ncbi:MAG: hypothetical protein ACKVS6_07655 [Planctomycetota bacterium]
MEVSNKSPRRLAFVIFLIALSLRLAAIDHGLPGLYVPDSHSVRNALGMLKDKNPVPRSNQYSSYPYLYSYICIPAFAADYAVARATGRAKSAAEYQQWATAHLERFHYIARIISAFAGALAAAAAVCAGFYFAGRRAGMFAGLLVSTSPMFLLLSTHERPWSLVLAFSTISISGALLYFKTGKLTTLFWSGLAAGAAGGCHQIGLAAAAIPIAAAWFRDRGFTVTSLVPSVRAAFVGGVGIVIMFLAGNPYLIRYGLSGGVPTALTKEMTDVSLGGQGFKFDFNAQYTVEALVGILSMEGIVCILAIAGAWIYRKERAAWILLALAVPIVLIFIPYKGTHARYFMIAFPAAWILAGAALDAIARRMGIWPAAAILAIPVILSIRLDQLLLRDDSRNVALAQIQQIIPAHAKVALEPYGPAIAADTASLERLAALNPLALTQRERMALDRRSSGGFDILPMERVCGDATANRYQLVSALGEQYFPGVKNIPELLDRANLDYVVRVERFPQSPRKDPFAAWVEKKGEIAGDWSPAPGRTPAECLLPFEPRLGAYALFTVERPGPRIRLYKIRKS